MGLKLFKVGGKIYEELGMSGGYVYLGSIWDPNREVIKEGVIWYMQPFYYDNEISYLIKIAIYVVRYFMKDCLGRSQFLMDI